MQTEKKYVEVIDDDLYNSKIEFKVKSKIIEMNSNYKKIDKKIWRVLKCKEMHSVIVFTKFDLYNSIFESLFSQIIRIWKLFFRPVVTYFSWKCLYLQWRNRSSA